MFLFTEFDELDVFRVRRAAFPDMAVERHPVEAQLVGLLHAFIVDAATGNNFHIGFLDGRFHHLGVKAAVQLTGYIMEHGSQEAIVGRYHLWQIQIGSPAKGNAPDQAWLSEVDEFGIEPQAEFLFQVGGGKMKALQVILQRQPVV